VFSPHCVLNRCFSKEKQRFNTQCGENTELTETKREKALRRKNRARSEEGPVVNMLPSPPPGCFCQRVRNGLKIKELIFFEVQRVGGSVKLRMPRPLYVFVTIR